MTRRQDAPSNAIERHTGDDDGDDIDGDNGNDEDDATDLGEIRLQCPRSEVAALVAGKHIPLPGMITNLQSATARQKPNPAARDARDVEVRRVFGRRVQQVNLGSDTPRAAAAVIAAVAVQLQELGATTHALVCKCRRRVHKQQLARGGGISISISISTFARLFILCWSGKDGKRRDIAATTTSFA